MTQVILLQLQYTLCGVLIKYTVVLSLQPVTKLFQNTVDKSHFQTTSKIHCVELMMGGV